MCRDRGSVSLFKSLFLQWPEFFTRASDIPPVPVRHLALVLFQSGDVNNPQCNS